MFTVGNEIEYSFNEEDWFKCKIDYVVKNNGVDGVVATCCINPNKVKQYLDASSTFFRDLDKSAE
ncbi:hypothetical protein D3C75_1294370 [compost metagenome]